MPPLMDLRQFLLELQGWVYVVTGLHANSISYYVGLSTGNLFAKSLGHSIGVQFSSLFKFASLHMLSEK